MFSFLAKAVIVAVVASTLAVNIWVAVGIVVAAELVYAVATGKN